MEMIIMLAVIAALIALVYWKNVKNDVSVSAGQRPEEQPPVHWNMLTMTGVSGRSLNN